MIWVNITTFSIYRMVMHTLKICCICCEILKFCMVLQWTLDFVWSQDRLFSYKHYPFTRQSHKWIENIQTMCRQQPTNCFFFYLGFLSRTFTNHRTAGEGEGISLTPHYHFHPLHRHLDISRAITAESSPLHIASSRIQTGNLWFPSASR